MLDEMGIDKGADELGQLIPDTPLPTKNTPNNTPTNNNKKLNTLRVTQSSRLTKVFPKLYILCITCFIIYRIRKLLLPWIQIWKRQYTLLQQKKVKFVQKTIEFGDTHSKVPTTLSHFLNTLVDRTTSLKSDLKEISSNTNVSETLDVARDVNLYVSSQTFSTMDGYGLPKPNAFTNSLHQIKSEIRSVKGSLLSSRNFPTPLS